MSSNILKIIAIVTMLIDHIGATIILGFYLADQSNESLFLLYNVSRGIGRIAFPIFSFLLVQGFLNTHNVKKYAFRLFLFALISEIPFDLAFYGKVFESEFQNVFFTLFIGLIMIWSIDSYGKMPQTKRMIYSVLIFFSSIMIVEILKTDYAATGIILILTLYLFNYKRELQCTAACVVFLTQMTQLNTYFIVGILLSFIAIYFYNGNRGRSINKYVFYAFYPMHLLILYMLV